MDVLVVAVAGLRTDLDLVREIVASECAALDVAGRVATVADATGVTETVAAARTGAVVVLPGRDPAVRRLMTAPGPHTGRTVWCDITRTGPVPVAGGAAHLHGRGVWGVVWAVRHAVHRLRHPARRIHYGPGDDQWAELRLPADPSSSRVPVAVLVHGGYWRSVWRADLMDALAIDLAGRGFASWNLEYRSPDRDGWDATTADVASGLSALAGAGLEVGAAAVIGHSAGGQLALRAAADDPRVGLGVSLAGVLDLVEAQRRGTGNGAVAAALGGDPEQVPDRYAASDPMARLPLRVPQLVVQGSRDDPDLVDCGRRFAAAARAAGDRVTYLEQACDHFAVIDPTSQIWQATVTEIQTHLPAVVDEGDS